MFPIFDKLGGLEATMKLLQPLAIRDTWPSAVTVRVWRKNGRLPSPVVRRLMEICDAQGVEYTSRDFVIGNIEQAA
jgi:hypothetical protein